MAFEQEGVLHKVFPTESKTATFQAREFVIRIEGNYPQFVKFQLTQDKCDVIDNFKEGDTIKVSFDLRGREWNEKYFTNLNAWRVDAVSQENTESSGPKNQFAPMEEAYGTDTLTSNPKASESEMKAEDFDDLPF